MLSIREALDAMMAQGAPPAPAQGATAPGPPGVPPPDPAAAGGVNCQVCGYTVDPSGAPIGIWDPALAQATAPFEDPDAMGAPGAAPAPGGLPPMPPPA